MRRFLAGTCLLLVWGWAALPVQAREEGHAGPPKYVVEGHGEDGKKIKAVLDMNNPEHVRELTEHLKAGHVEHVKPEKKANIGDLSWDLGLWTLVIFLLLFFILRKVAWGPMLEGLRKREQDIRMAAEEAKVARAETEQARADFQRQMREAYQEIPKIMEEARRDATNLFEQMKTKATTEIQTERQRLRREIDTAKDQALQEVWNQAGELATLISGKVVRRELTADDHRRLVDEALTELSKANVGWKQRNVS